MHSSPDASRFVGGELEPGIDPDSAAARSLCARCRHVKLVRSEKGSVFLLCRLAAHDARFAKYPPQPVLACAGFER
jgi:hypothetical protein